MWDGPPLKGVSMKKPSYLNVPVGSHRHSSSSFTESLRSVGFTEGSYDPQTNREIRLQLLNPIFGEFHAVIKQVEEKRPAANTYIPLDQTLTKGFQLTSLDALRQAKPDLTNELINKAYSSIMSTPPDRFLEVFLKPGTSRGGLSTNTESYLIDFDYLSSQKRVLAKITRGPDGAIASITPEVTKQLAKTLTGVSGH